MFKEFELIDVLNVERANCIPSKENLIDGNIPYVTRSAVNNGKTRTCGNIEKINKGNCISVGGEGGAVFYQPVDWVAGNNMCRLWKDGLEMEHYLYIVGIMNKITNTYSYSNARTQEKIKKETLYLPVIENSNPDHEYTVDDVDWQYMHDRITELEHDRITELERDRITELDAYLQATGLNDYELTEDDKKILSLSIKRASDEDGTLEDNSEDEVRFELFRVDEIFEVVGTKSLDAGAIEFKDKGINFVGRTYENNGIQGKIDKQDYEPNNANTITATVIGNYKYVKYQEEPYYCSQNINKLTLLDKFNYTLNRLSADYLIALIRKFVEQYNGQQGGYKLLELKGYKMLLPIKSDGTPDFDYMERYIRAIEKVVVADVVKHKDKVIETMKSITTKTSTTRRLLPDGS